MKYDTAPITREYLAGQLDRLIHQLDKRFERMEEQNNLQFEKIDKRFQQMQAQNDSRFEQMDSRFEQMDSRFEQMDKKIDKRFDELSDRITKEVEGLARMTAKGFADLQEQISNLATRTERIEHVLGIDPNDDLAGVEYVYDKEK